MGRAHRSDARSRSQFLVAGAAWLRSPSATRRAPARRRRRSAQRRRASTRAYEGSRALPDASVHATTTRRWCPSAERARPRRGDRAWLDGALGEFQARAGDGRSASSPPTGARRSGATSVSPRGKTAVLAGTRARRWRQVLRRWVPRLAPGLAGAATHGLIRSGHGAPRARVRDNAVRRRELAPASPTGRHLSGSLPWDGRRGARASVAAAFARLAPRLPPSNRRAATSSRA